jgi:hypothetical protein
MVKKQKSKKKVTIADVNESGGAGRADTLEFSFNHDATTSKGANELRTASGAVMGDFLDDLSKKSSDHGRSKGSNLSKPLVTEE